MMNMTQSERSERIAADLPQAIVRAELELHFQPIVRLAERRVEAVEALLRWRHPALGPISPAELVPIAERTGAIVAIGRWVLREALRQASAWAQAGLALRVAVNLSARQLSDPELLPLLSRTLAQTRLAAGSVEIELTESLAADPRTASELLGGLRLLGARVALDDFGTGYSSLASVAHLPLDTLKVDRSFIADAARDRRVRAVLASIVAMAHELSLETVAEGVETAAQQTFVTAAGCDLAQGYLHSPPLPAAECERWLRQRREEEERRARRRSRARRPSSAQIARTAARAPTAGTSAR